MKGGRKDFDFDMDEDILDDEPKVTKATKQQPKEQFFDMEEDIYEPPNKLPIINQRSSARLPSNQKPTEKANVKLQQLPKRDVTYDFVDLDQDASPVVPPKHNKQQNKSIQQYKSEPIQPEPQPEPEPQEKYDEDFEAQNYDDDFEEPEEPKSVKKIEKKPETPPRNLSVGARKEVVKQKPTLKKSSSKASLKSNNSRRSQQKRAHTNIGHIAPDDQVGKFSAEVASTFPETNLNGYTLDNLNKLNQRVRGMIRRFNDDLNQILTKNTMLLKAKGTETSNEKGVESRIAVLNEQKKNNDKMLQRMEEELNRLRFRQGKLKDEDYEVQLHKRIQTLNERKKETQKQIYKLKLSVSNQGKKLTTNKPQIDPHGHNTFKNELVHQKKEQIRLVELLGNVEKKLADIEPKHSDVEDRLNSLLRQANKAGIELQPKTGLKSKYEQLQKKYEAERKNMAMLEGLFKSKKEKANQQITLLRRSTQNMEAQIKNIHTQIVHSIELTREAIQRARETTKIPKNIESSLQAVSQSLIINELEFDKMTQKSNKSHYSEKPRLQSAGKKKVEPSSQEFLPLNPKKLAKNVEEEQKPNMSPVAKPNFKKKEQVQDKQAAQRIWKDDQPLKEPPRMSHKPEPEQPVIQQPPPPADNSKPMFMLKKKKDNSIDVEPSKSTQPLKPEFTKPAEITKPQENFKPIELTKAEPIEQKLMFSRPEEPKQNEVKADYDKPFGGRMMKLRKNNDQSKQEPNSQNSTIETKPAYEFSSNPTSNNSSQRRLQMEDKSQPTVQPPAVQQPVLEDKPIMPRRMMMKKKTDGDNDGGYNPTFKKEEPVIEPTKDSETVKPRVFKLSNDPQPPQKDTKPFGMPKAEEPKPAVVNPKVANNNPYAPTSNPYAPQIQQDKPVRDVNKNPYAPVKDPVVSNNPYAQNANQPPRQREGRVKKNKIEIGKEKFNNIYEAAEEPALNEFIPEVKPMKLEQPKKEHKHQELDINALLGIKQKSNKDDPEDELLFGAAKKEQKKQDKKPTITRKRQNDLFDGFDV